MSTAIKPIETIYNGYRFRSRLEARWAVFFDALGLQYRYETQGFDLDGKLYLPDFQLHFFKCEQDIACGCWLEVKSGFPSNEESEKAIRLCLADRLPVCILSGDPWYHAYELIAYLPLRPEKMEEITKQLKAYDDLHWLSPTRAISIVYDDEETFPAFLADLKRGYVGIYTFFAQCIHCGAIILPNVIICRCHKKGDNSLSESDIASPCLRRAFIAARQARFEHGERP